MDFQTQVLHVKTKDGDKLKIDPKDFNPEVHTRMSEDDIQHEAAQADMAREKSRVLSDPDLAAEHAKLMAAFEDLREKHSALAATNAQLLDAKTELEKQAGANQQELKTLRESVTAAEDNATELLAVTEERDALKAQVQQLSVDLQSAKDALDKAQTKSKK